MTCNITALEASSRSPCLSLLPPVNQVQRIINAASSKPYLWQLHFGSLCSCLENEPLLCFKGTSTKLASFLCYSLLLGHTFTLVPAYPCGVWDTIVAPSRVGLRLLLHWQLAFPGELLPPPPEFSSSTPQRQSQAPMAAAVISKRHRAGDPTPSLHLPHVSIQMHVNFHDPASKGMRHHFCYIRLVEAVRQVCLGPEGESRAHLRMKHVNIAL